MRAPWIAPADTPSWTTLWMNIFCAVTLLRYLVGYLDLQTKQNKTAYWQYQEHFHSDWMSQPDLSPVLQRG